MLQYERKRCKNCKRWVNGKGRFCRLTCENSYDGSDVTVHPAPTDWTFGLWVAGEGEEYGLGGAW